MIGATGLMGIKDSQDTSRAIVQRVDKTTSERGPARAHHQGVVLLIERDNGFDDDLPYPSAAMIGEVSVELLDPGLGREDERDCGFHPPTEPRCCCRRGRSR